MIEDIDFINNESLYKSLFKNNKAIMFLINPVTSDIEDCNLSACYFYGYSYDEILKLKITSFNVLSKEQVVKEMNLAKTEQRKHYYFKHQQSNGKVRDVAVHSTPINLKGKKLLLVTIEDITDSKVNSNILKNENDLSKKTMAERIYELEEINAKLKENNELLGKRNEILSIILENSPDIIFALDCNYRYLLFNTKHRDTMRAIWGKEIEIGMCMLDVISKYEDRKKAKINFDRALAGERFSLIEEYGDENLLRSFWEDSYFPMFSTEGNIIGLTCHIQDITQRKSAEIELLHEKNLLDAISNSAQGLIYLYDTHHRLVRWNKKHNDMTGYSSEELCRMSLMDWFKGDEKSQKAIREGITRVTEERFGDAEAELQIKDGTTISMYFTFGALNYNGNQYLAGIGVDITERKKKEAEILFLSYHDQLTGLYNRSFFVKERKLLDTERQLPLSVIIGDINGLKLLNDAFGHAEGDKLLVEMAKLLKSCCREEDILARTGGDEFSILLPKTDSNGAQLIVKRIKKACEEYINKTDKGVYYASISLGHATKYKVEEPFAKIFKDAEEFMYRRKLLEHKSLHNSILSSIKTTMFEKSNETEEHAERLAKVSRKLGQALGLSEEELVELELSCTLHDIGKIAIDDTILKKPGKLTNSEWHEIKRHPEVGFRIAQASPELKHISEYILCHHERWDGKGYPQGLEGENIPLISRILALVDSYDAMTKDRVYKKAITIEEAVTEIKKNGGTQFDPEIARIFVEKVLDKHWE